AHDFRCGCRLLIRSLNQLRFWLLELRVSQHFSTFYEPSVQAMDIQLGGRHRRRTPANVGARLGACTEAVLGGRYRRRTPANVERGAWSVERGAWNVERGAKWPLVAT
ncbi:MAG: hypothetical protein ACXVBO_03020, partial [Isosphaeraceae bacterium]